MRALACILALAAAGCGSSGHGSTVTSERAASTLQSLRMCLRQHGYAVSPESSAVLGTAPRGFDFVEVWNIVNPSRVALALTFSRDPAGAARAAAWARRENAKVGRGVVVAPVVRIGTIDVLWTATPPARDMNDVYGCVRRSG